MESALAIVDWLTRLGVTELEVGIDTLGGVDIYSTTGDLSLWHYCANNGGISVVLSDACGQCGMCWDEDTQNLVLGRITSEIAA